LHSGIWGWNLASKQGHIQYPFHCCSEVKLQYFHARYMNITLLGVSYYQCFLGYNILVSWVSGWMWAGDGDVRAHQLMLLLHRLDPEQQFFSCYGRIHDEMLQGQIYISETTWEWSHWVIWRARQRRAGVSSCYFRELMYVYWPAADR